MVAIMCLKKSPTKCLSTQFLKKNFKRFKLDLVRLPFFRKLLLCLSFTLIILHKNVVMARVFIFKNMSLRSVLKISSMNSRAVRHAKNYWVIRIPRLINLNIYLHNTTIHALVLIIHRAIKMNCMLMFNMGCDGNAHGQ